MPNQLVNYYRATYPKEAAGMSDDDITIKYGGSLEDFKAKGTDLLATYPDFADDWNRIKNKEIADATSYTDYAKHAAGTAWRGVAGIPGSIVSGAATLTRKLTGGDIDVEDSVRAGADKVSNALMPDFDPKKEEYLSKSWLSSKLPEAGGSILGFAATGGAIGMAGKAAGIVGTAGASTFGVGAAGAASGFDEQYRKALAKTGDKETAFRAGLLGAGVGISEIAPVSKFVDRLSKIAPSIKSSIAEMILDGAKEGLEETLQEGFQSAAGDAIAAQIIKYDPDLKEFDSMIEDSGVGGASGFLASILTHKIAHFRSRVAESPKNAAGPAQPEDTIKPGSDSPDPIAPKPGEQTAVDARDVLNSYGIEIKGVNDLVARAAENGPESVASEVATLSPDAKRLYDQKLLVAIGAKKIQDEINRAKSNTNLEKEGGDAKDSALAGAAEAAPGGAGQSSPSSTSTAVGANAAPASTSTPAPVAEASTPEPTATAVPEPATDPLKLPPSPEQLAEFAQKHGYVPEVKTLEQLIAAEDALSGKNIESKKSNAVQESAAGEVGVRNPSEVGQGVVGQDQGQGNQAAQVGEGGGQEGQGQVVQAAPTEAAPAAPAPAPEAPAAPAAPAAPTAPPKRKVESIATAESHNQIEAAASKFHVENTGEDSREFIGGQLQEIKDQAEAFGKMRLVISDVLARLEKEKKEGKSNSIPLTDTEKQALLGIESGIAKGSRTRKSNGESAALSASSVAKVKVLVDRANAGELNVGALKRYAEVLANLQGDAITRLSRMEGKAGDLAKEGGKVTADQLLNWESVNYMPQNNAAGYFEVGDGSKEGKITSQLLETIKTTDDPDLREKALDSLGATLATGSRVAKSTGATKRLVAWLSPNGKVTVMSAFDQRTGKEANSKWRYSVGPLNRKIEKGNPASGGMVGITLLIDAGYTPIGSVSMLTARGRVAISFDSRAAYDSAFGKDAREANRNTKQRASEIESTGVFDSPVAAGSQDPHIGTDADRIGRKREEGSEAEKALSGSREIGGSDIQDALLLIEENLDLVKHAYSEFQKARNNPDLDWGKILDALIQRFSDKIVADGIPDAEVIQMKIYIGDMVNALFSDDRKWVKFNDYISKKYGSQQNKAEPAKSGEQAGGAVQDVPAGSGVVLEGGGADGGNSGVPQASTEAGPKEAEGSSTGTGEAAAGAGEPAPSGDVVSVVETANAISPDVQEAWIRSIGEVDRITETGLYEEGEIQSMLNDIDRAAREGKKQKINDVISRILTDHEERLKEYADEHGEPPEQINDDDGASYRLLPDSPEAASYNLSRKKRKPSSPVSPEGLSGVVSLAELQRLYPTVADALKRISEIDTSIHPSMMVNGKSVFGLIADAMGKNVDVTGARMVIVDDAKMFASIKGESGKTESRGVAGKYDPSSNTFVVNVAACRDLSDFHQTILHETVHAYVDRLIMRYYGAPATLLPFQRSAIESLVEMVEMAKLSDLKWQQSGESGDVSLREFITAAMTDKEFQTRLAMTENPFVTQNTSILKTLWTAIKQLIAKVIAGQVRLYTMKEQGLDAVPIKVEDSMLPESLRLVEVLIDGYNERTAMMDRIVTAKLRTSKSSTAAATNSKIPVSYQLVGGMFKTKRDISVDGSAKELAVREGAVMMVTTNVVDSTINRMLNAWRTVGGWAGKTQEDYVKKFLASVYNGRLQQAEEVRDAINNALANQGAPIINRAISDTDLDARGEAPRANKDALKILNGLRARLNAVNKAAETLFAKGVLLKKLNESNQNLHDLRLRYTDLGYVKGVFLKELRRSIDQRSASVGVFRLASTLGVSSRATVVSAMNRIQGNLDAHVDALIAMSKLGIDYGDIKRKIITPLDVSNAVIGAVATHPELAGLAASPAEMAVAINFAARNPMVMHLLFARTKGSERVVLDSILRMATEARPDAFDRAKAELGKLHSLGKTARAVLELLREEKSNNDEILAKIEYYKNIIEYNNSSGQILSDEIRRLERSIGMETGIRERQFAPVHGERYFVPQSPHDSEEQVFLTSLTNPGYKTLLLGSQFDGAQLNKDRFAMKEWLNANRHLSGSANYSLMERQYRLLSKLYMDNATYAIQRGPGGWFVRVFGDVATRAEHTGTHAGRALSQLVRSFNSIYEGNLKVPEQMDFHEADALKHKAMRATGMFDKVFDSYIYNRAFGYLESRRDLIDRTIPPDQQIRRSVDAAIRVIASENPIPMSKPGAEDAVRAFLIKSVQNNDITQSVRVKNKLKVKDDSGISRDSSVVFREAIGSSAHTMSRSVASSIRALVSGVMDTGDSWNSMITLGVNSLNAEDVSTLYTSNRPALDDAIKKRFTKRVIDDFVVPLVYKDGESNFWGIDLNGLQNKAQRQNVIDAWVRGGGDVIRFAEELNALEGGSAATLAEFVGQTLATFEKYYRMLKAANDSIKSVNLDQGAVMARSLLDARQGDDFPHQWLDYRQFGHDDMVRYMRMFALQAAFGQEGSDAANNIDAMIKELEILKGDAERAENAPTIAERDAILGTGQMRQLRLMAAQKLSEAVRIKEDFHLMVKNMNGMQNDYAGFQKLVGLLSGYTVQGLGTAFTDEVSLSEAPFRKFGFSKSAIDFIVKSKKNLALEVVDSLWQTIGRQFHWNAEWIRHREAINSSGGIDTDALADKRGPMFLLERYRQLVADEDSFRAVWERTEGMPMERVKRVSSGVSHRAMAALRMGLEVGVGKAKSDATAAVTFKPWAPFTYINQLMHRAVMRTWLQTVEAAIDKSVAYMRANPHTVNDPTFKLTASNLQYSGKGLLGVSIDGKDFNYLTETLNLNGISLEEAARRVLRGEQALSEDQVHSVASLAQTEILMNSSVVTRPSWSYNSVPGKLASPIIGWGLYRMTDLVKSTRDSKGRAEINAAKQAAIAFALGVLPAALAYALLRDEYDEEIVGKKTNVLPLKADSTLPLAIMDQLSRVGTLGAAGDMASSIFNVSTSRDFSVESRVFAISAMVNVMKTVGYLYQQDGNATYATTWRPIIQSIGGSGYLNNFDAINNVLDLDNAERRIVRRINVANQLRVAGREMDLDVRVSRGISSMPNPMKPWIGEMVLAAYANDHAGFREAYTKALAEATRIAIEDHKEDADPVADVAEAFSRMHPLRSVFNKAPTTAEYQRVLRQLGDAGTEVSAAIRNFNSYGAQIPRKRGGEGITPYYGTDRKEKVDKSRTSTTMGSGYRSLVTTF